MTGVVLALGILLLLFLLLVFLVAPGRPPQGRAALPPGEFAHRGLYEKNQRPPENSLAAFGRAVKAGYGIELDVNLTADGHAVVFHDDTLTRMCGLERRVNDCTLRELRGLALAGTGEGIPLFSEVLQLVDGRVPLIVELKNCHRYQELCKVTAAALKAYGGSYCVESFSPLIVRWFKTKAPGVVRGQLAMGSARYRNLPWYLRFSAANLLSNVLTRPHFVAYRIEDARHSLPLTLYRALGGKLVAWTVHEKDDQQFAGQKFHSRIFEWYRPRQVQ